MFLPNIRCPHCSGATCVAISGYGGELNNREKVCKFCEKTFFVQILVQTTVAKKIEDGKISDMKRKIKFLSDEREKTYVELLISHETAAEINRQALIKAVEMRRKNKMN